jgi:hypothetical protein
LRTWENPRPTLEHVLEALELALSKFRRSP